MTRQNYFMVKKYENLICALCYIKKHYICVVKSMI